MPESKHITANGLRLHYLDHGTEGKRWLVCVHGLTSNAHAFDAVAPHLTHDFHVLALDVRGRGDSEWGPPDEYAPTAYVKDLVAVMDELGIARATLVGTSMGGIISMAFAGSYPERVERVVLNDIGPEIDPAGISRIVNYNTQAPAEFDNLEQVASWYREYYPTMRKQPLTQIAEQVKWSVKPGASGKLVWKMDPQIRQPPRGQAARPLDMWMLFARIEAPMLVIRGGDSDILAVRTVEKMKSVHTNVESVEVPGVAHAPSLVEEESLAAIRKFLEIRQ